MKKIEAYIKSERLKETINKLKEIKAPGFTYYNVTGHGKEEKVKVVVAGRAVAAIREDILPRTKIEVVCNDDDTENIVNAIREGCCISKPGDGMVFVSPVTDAYRLRTKEKVSKIE